MMKKLYLLAAAALTLAACTDEAYLGENKALTNTDNPIGFNMSTPAMSRADITGKTAADALKDSFFVYGIKNEKTKVGTIKTDGSDPNNVMNNYVVKYNENSAMTSTSNTEGWEYVGYALTANETTNVTPNAGSEGTPTAPKVQTIKYWDWGAEDYTFTAVSARTEDIERGAITIAKVNNVTESVYKNGYTIKFKAVKKQGSTDYDVIPDVANVYIADRENIVKSNNTDRTKDNAYGGNVTFTFRSLGTKVRAAMYETVPGYTVTIDKMYNGEATPAAVLKNFVADCTNRTTPTDGTEFTANVTYYDNSTENASVTDQPTVEFVFPEGVKANNTLTLGPNIHGVYTEESTTYPGTTLGESITKATYDKVDASGNGLYTFVLPQEENTDSMVVKLDYTLTCTATGEKITVEGAKAVVPAEYLKWKPNFSYTYMFKISDNTNGYTGGTTDPVGLYPITFDAVVVDAGDGLAEYITTVSEPSITTFGATYDDDDNFVSYVADKDAYVDGTNIYATVVVGKVRQDLTTSGKEKGNVNLYTVTTSDATNFPITEAAVAEAIYETAAGKVDADDTKLTVTALTKGTDYSFVEKVPGEDGVEIAMKALKWTGKALTGTPAKEQYYAIEYITESEVPAEYEQVASTAPFDENATYYTKTTSGSVETYTKCENLTAFASGTTYYTLKTAYVPAKAQYKVVIVKPAE